MFGLQTRSACRKRSGFPQALAFKPGSMTYAEWKMNCTKFLTN